MVRAARAATRSGSAATCAFSRVGTNPGHTELQHTPDRAHASDCDRVSGGQARPSTPRTRRCCANARWACCEVTLMIRPQPRAAIAGPNRWPSRNGAVRLTAMVRSQSSTLSDGSGGRRLTPAQLTRMSGAPNAAAASSAARATAARDGQVRADPGHPSRPPRAARPPPPPAAPRPARPAPPAPRPSASARAIASPIPELPPVTTATRPASENSSSRYAVTGRDARR